MSFRNHIIQSADVVTLLLGRLLLVRKLTFCSSSFFITEKWHVRQTMHQVKTVKNMSRDDKDKIKLRPALVTLW